ncbi:MAG: single-stranded DNA-binding protein [bacterium]|nr:single-stranded DNA-binding protein [bacterium]
MNVNIVILVGRLTDNPESRTTPGGQQVCSFRMATNRAWTDRQGTKQERVEYHTVIAWRRLAEIASQYLAKGGLVFVEGHLETRSWQGADGSKKYRTEIIADRLQLGPKSGGGTMSSESNQKKEKEEAPIQEEIPIIEENQEIDVKDIPF